MRRLRSIESFATGDFTFSVARTARSSSWVLAVVLSLFACGSERKDADEGGDAGDGTGGVAGSEASGGRGGSSGASAGEGGDAETGGGGSGNSGGTSGGAGGAAAGGAAGQAGVGGSGGTAGAGGASGSSGQGGSAGMMVAPPISNLPGITFDVQTDADAAGVVLVSSNLMQDADTFYIEWYGIVRNTASVPTCQLRAALTFQTALGTVLLELSSYANAEPYDGSITSSIACIGPGKLGSFWSNNLPDAPIDLAAIRTITVSLDGNRYAEAIPHPMAPTVSTAALAQHSTGGEGTWTVSGSMTATATVYNLGADIDLVSADGWIVDRLTAFHLETFTQGMTWDFETTNYFRGTRPAEYLLFNDFIEGAGPAAELGPPRPTPAWAPRAAEIAQRTKELTAAQRARKSRALAASRR